MRQQRKLLKDHRHFLTADASKHLLAALNEVVVTEDDFLCRGLDQSVDVADQGGLAGPRQAHDDGDLTRFNIDIDVLKTQDVAGL